MDVERTTPARSRAALLLLLGVGITVMLFLVVRQFATALVLAAVLAGCTRSVHGRIAGRLGGRTRVAAILVVVLVLVIVVLPALLTLGVLFDEAVEIGARMETWVSAALEDPDTLENAVRDSPTLRHLVPYQDQIVTKVGELAAGAASFLAGVLVGGATGGAEFILMLFVTLCALFAFLKDGSAAVDWAFDCTPLTAADRERIVETFTSVARATLKGSMVIALVQGALAGAAFAVAGIEGAVFWGAVMAMLSVVPGIGSALVWVPAVIYLLLIDRTGTAVALAAWCGLVVGTVDNVLQPLLVGKDTRMPDLLILLTTLGGLVLFGITGVVLGPIVGALFLTIWKQWGSAVKEASSGCEEQSLAT